MKKVILFLIVFTTLAGCQKVPGEMMTKSSLKEFEISEQCPYVCWLGINPGVTSAEDAERILRASAQIDQNRVEVSESFIRTAWYVGPSTRPPASVSVQVERQIVTGISFGSLPFKMKDLADRFGEPDLISIGWVIAPDAEYIEYFVYYSIQKILLDVPVGSSSGPNSENRVVRLFLNKGFSEISLPVHLHPFQPWLGYGHLNDYLPDGMPIP